MKWMMVLLALTVPVAAQPAKKQVTLEITLKDHIAFRRGGVWTPAGDAHVTNWYVRMPAAFFDGKKLTAAAEDYFYANLYGPTWKDGNGDGSRYMPVEAAARVLTAKEIAGQLWTTKNRQLVVFGTDGKVLEKLK
jgi:hypothetical protein